jgi:hypothetical protein
MTRARLPNRRRSESFTFECSGLRYTATSSQHANRLRSRLLGGEHGGAS